MILPKLLLTLPVLVVVPNLGSCRSRPDPYGPLQATFAQYIQKQDELFQKRIFTLSDFQLQSSIRPKLVVEDQLGKKWLFKMGKETSDGAVAVYRLFRLFGLRTPEIHPMFLPINDKRVFGTLQELVPNAMSLPNITYTGDASEPDYSRLSADSLSYLLRAHIFSWLAACYHTHPMQYIYDTHDGQTRLYRIDNSVEWYLVGQDQLRYDYVSPYLQAINSGLWKDDAGFVRFWQSYLNAEIDLPLAETLDLVRFVAGYPEEEYVDFFAPGIANGFRYFANSSMPAITEATSEAVARGKRYGFLSRIKNRKKAAAERFEQFYRQMASLRGERVDLTSRSAPAAIGQQLANGLRKELERMGRVEPLLAQSPGEQKSVNAIISFDAFEILQRFYRSSSPTELQHRYALSLEELTRLRDETDNPFELKAIDLAETRIHQTTGLLIRPVEEELTARQIRDALSTQILTLGENRLFVDRKSGEMKDEAEQLKTPLRWMLLHVNEIFPIHADELQK